MMQTHTHCSIGVIPLLHTHTLVACDTRHHRNDCRPRNMYARACLYAPHFVPIINSLSFNYMCACGWLVALRTKTCTPAGARKTAPTRKIELGRVRSQRYVVGVCRWNVVQASAHVMWYVCLPLNWFSISSIAAGGEFVLTLDSNGTYTMCWLWS